MKKILVADDSETITTLLTTALESNGYEVSSASDGNEAYQLQPAASGRAGAARALPALRRRGPSIAGSLRPWLGCLTCHRELLA